MKELTLEITNKCYQNCPWCSSSSTPDGKDVPLDKVLDILTKFRSECSVLRLSGGEPPLHRDFRLILEKAKKLGYHIDLMTSGDFPYDFPLPIFWEVDNYLVHISSTKSIRYIQALEQSLEKNIFLHAVLVKGNEFNIKDAITLSMEHNIPLRLLVLQKQGRGVSCEPLNLISWTSDQGCGKDDKVTVAHDGGVVTCSALKYKDTCDLVCNA